MKKFIMIHKTFNFVKTKSSYSINQLGINKEEYIIREYPLKTKQYD